jgi:hypothetical protein
VARLDAETDLMDAQPALHPTDQTLHAYGLGKLDEASAESVNAQGQRVLFANPYEQMTCV